MYMDFDADQRDSDFTTVGAKTTACSVVRYLVYRILLYCITETTKWE